MENDWIKDNIEALKKLYIENEDEQAIASYTISVIKLLNGMQQIMHGEFHRYERVILGVPVRLFCTHFQEQISLAKKCGNDLVRKIEIIQDVEDAVVQISQVYKNVVDSTANADKRMFMSLSVDTSLYELSPKLCGMYASILERLANLYDDSEKGLKEYAFLIHPTLESMIKAKVLFKKRDASGKVVVVYIPVNILDQTDIVSVMVLHEAYHVLTKKQRGRHRRVTPLINAALLEIRECLFKGTMIDDGIKKELMKIWFGKTKDYFMQQCSVQEENDHRWYSERLVHDMTDILLKDLLYVNQYILQNGLAEVYMYGDDFGFMKCLEKYKNAKGEAEQILENLYRLVTWDTLFTILNRHMSILREAYADIACIITARLEPELYDKAFERSVQLKVQKDIFEDKNRKVRQMLVYCTVIECSGDKEFSQKWEVQWKNAWEKSADINLSDITGQSVGQYDTIEWVLQKYFLYLKRCFWELQNTIESNSGIEKFRKDLKSVFDRQEEVFFAVLGGVHQINFKSEENV